MNLARTSIKRPVGVLMVMLIVILLGAVSLTELNLDLLPQITPPVAAVITTFRGALPMKFVRPLQSELRRRLSLRLV